METYSVSERLITLAGYAAAIAALVWVAVVMEEEE